MQVNNNNISILREFCESQSLVFYNGEPGRIIRMEPGNFYWEEYCFQDEVGGIPLHEDKIMIRGNSIEDL